MHVLREFFLPLANSYSSRSPVWRVSLAVVGILLCLIGGQAIFDQFAGYTASSGPAAGPGPARDDFSGREILLAGQYGLSLLSAAAAIGIILRQERGTSLEPAIPNRPFGKRRAAQPAMDAAPAP